MAEKKNPEQRTEKHKVRSSIEEQIKSLEDELKKTQYNKATQHHVGLVKAKIAMLKDKQLARATKGKKGEGYSVRKSGDATVILLGFPSVGKSTLLNHLTGANSPVGSYDFTTLDVIPGLLEYNHAKIQILDVPGVVYGAASGRGRGKEVLAVMRGADLAVILLDVNHPGHLKVLKKEVYDAGIRINEKKPDVKIRKTAKDGVRIGKTIKLSGLDDETIRTIMKEFKIVNAEVIIRSQLTADQLIDMIEGNKVYIPAIIVLNKIDLVSDKKLNEIKKTMGVDLCISADKDVNIQELKKLIYEKLEFIGIYCKEAGKKADLGIPMILKTPVTIQTMCEKLHKDFVTRFKFARVWGSSAKFPGQRFNLNHELKDKDVVELHIG